MHDEPKRILYYSEGWGFGGIERFIMNTVVKLDPAQYRFDIFCTHDWSDVYDDTITRLGGRRYVVFKGHKPDLVKRLFASTSAWKRLLRKNHYDVVHINTMNGVGFIYAHLARECGIPIRIVHCHNTTFGSGYRGIKTVAHKAGITLYSHDATDNLACSRDAGTFLFGKRPFLVIQNGVNTDQFAFDSGTRSEVRHDLGVEPDTVLFGALGRLSEAKNPLFQIRILHALRERGVSAELLLMGNGDLKRKVVECATSLHVKESLHLLDSTDQPEKYLDALDVFTLPSLYEGFPTMSLVEARANGLPCLASQEVEHAGSALTGVHFIPLTDVQEWASQVLLYSAVAENKRTEGKSIIETAGLDRESMVSQVLRLY